MRPIIYSYGFLGLGSLVRLEWTTSKEIEAMLTKAIQESDVESVDWFTMPPLYNKLFENANYP